MTLYPDGFYSDSIYFDGKLGARWGLAGSSSVNHIGLKLPYTRSPDWFWVRAYLNAHVRQVYE